MIEIARYVINLKDRPDRRAQMVEQLERIGWQANFLSSVRPTSANGFPSIGARGCFESHLAALERGKLSKSNVVIMEDDLNFIAGFSAAWNRALGELEAVDWSIFYPAHILDERDDYDQRPIALVPPNRLILCSHFVMFHRNAVPTIIDRLNKILARAPGHPHGGPMHVDGAYNTIRQQNNSLNTYVCYPSMGYQRSSRSDIADLRLIDRIEALRPMVARLRKIKQMFRGS